MKKLIIFILALSLLAGCARVGDGEKREETGYTSDQLAAAIIVSQKDLPELYAVKYGDPEFEAYSMIYLGGLSEDVTGGVICSPLGPLSSEVAVFAFDTGDEAESAVEPLRSYMESRADAFFGYAPEESALAETGVALSGGKFAAMFICRDPEAAREAFSACFDKDAPEPPDLSTLTGSVPGPTEPAGPSEVSDPSEASEPSEPPEISEPSASTEPSGPSEPSNFTDPTEHADPSAPTKPEGSEKEPPAEDVYDHDAVLAAFKSGDASGLAPKNLAVYRRCLEILDEVVGPDMSDYDKELAINDYLVFSIEYDPYALQEKPGLVYEPDCGNPYGALVRGYGICLGYAASFQLLMDMVGIKCLTVHGFARDWQEEHAWNEVELDGEWYCVDVTWNDPVFTGWVPDGLTRLMYARYYFNVTSEYMRATDHQWSEDVPEATGTKYAYAP